MIADVFRGQWTNAVKSIIEENNGKMMPVPGNMTNVFQPVNLTVNRSCKSFLHKHSQDWYSNEIRKQMEKGLVSHEIKVDVCISVLKPLHASWITKFYDDMRANEQIVLNGWKKSGASDVIRSQ